MICYKGKKIEFSINGSSHSNSLELVVKGLPKNIEISLKKIEEDLMLRNPKLFFNTQRNEKEYEKVHHPVYYHHDVRNIDTFTGGIR